MQIYFTEQSPINNKMYEMVLIRLNNLKKNFKDSKQKEKKTMGLTLSKLSDGSRSRFSDPRVFYFLSVMFILQEITVEMLVMEPQARRCSFQLDENVI